MIKKLLPTLSILFVAFIALAQPQPVANLTIFSEDGDKFFLVLNGERENNVAQTNLRVEDLPQPYYNAKIIFEDKTIPEINKNYLQLADANGAMMDVTYKIKKDKNNGKVTLRYFSMIPVQQNYVPASNVTVVRYGNPAPVTTVTQTTTTHTTPNTVDANVNVAGINMNVTINDPTLQTTTHTTTTHTTHTTEVVHEQPAQVDCVGAYPMSSGDFSNVLSTIKGQGFADTQLKTAKQIAGSNCLSTNQISEICKVFGFEETKLDFAKFAYDHCTEPKNYFKINNVFSFSSSSDELNDYVQGRQ
ncbi:MAG: DUF4476 domain-containing protein [Bacteroidetes bacterium]|nr:DUF4476 domain-containing protein [Bacteroidota bacterium]